MTSSNGNIYRVTGPFWVESTSHRFPSQMPMTRSFGVFLWSVPQQTVEQTIETHRAHYDVTVMNLVVLIDLVMLCNRSILPISHYSDIMCAIAYQSTSLIILYSTIYSGADKRKHQSSASLAIVGGIHRWPVNSPHKWPATRKMFPSDNVIMHIVTALALGKSFNSNDCPDALNNMATFMESYAFHRFLPNSKYLSYRILMQWIGLITIMKYMYH